MKKLFYVLFAAVIAFTTVSCSSCSNEKGNTLNFEESYMYAYNDMLVDQPDTSFRFYYASAWMNMNADEVVTSENVKLDSIEVLFQKAPEFIKTYKFYADGTIKIDTIEGTWLECMNINPDSICMTLNEVLDMLGKMDCHKPSSNVVVMRCPLAPPFNEHPDYMFGTPLDWMEINSCDTPEPPVNDTVIDTVE